MERADDDLTGDGQASQPRGHVDGVADDREARRLARRRHHDLARIDADVHGPGKATAACREASCPARLTIARAARTAAFGVVVMGGRHPEDAAMNPSPMTWGTVPPCPSTTRRRSVIQGRTTPKTSSGSSASASAV